MAQTYYGYLYSMAYRGEISLINAVFLSEMIYTGQTEKDTERTAFAETERTAFANHEASDSILTEDTHSGQVEKGTEATSFGETDNTMFDNPDNL